MRIGNVFVVLKDQHKFYIIVTIIYIQGRAMPKVGTPLIEVTSINQSVYLLIVQSFICFINDSERKSV